jgi:UDP-N-acetylmuramate: L-alanyl-gamma-D-glutamyl-meso-diaminopimelate ligase
MVKSCFESEKLEVFTDSMQLLESLKKIDWQMKNLLIMTSGNFSGVNLQEVANDIAFKV